MNARPLIVTPALLARHGVTPSQEKPLSDVEMDRLKSRHNTREYEQRQKQLAKGTAEDLREKLRATGNLETALCRTHSKVSGRHVTSIEELLSEELEEWLRVLEFALRMQAVTTEARP